MVTLQPQKNTEPITPSIDEEVVDVVPNLPIVSGREVVKVLSKVGYSLEHQPEAI
jgi:hypothetical protein